MALIPVEKGNVDNQQRWLQVLQDSSQVGQDSSDRRQICLEARAEGYLWDHVPSGGSFQFVLERTKGS